MNSPDILKWVKLSFRLQNGDIILLYEDGFGNTVNNYGNYRMAATRFAYVVRIANEIDDLINKAVDAFPRERDTRDGLVAVPLAVYVDFIDVLPGRRLFRDEADMYVRALIFGLFPKIPPWQLQPVIYITEHEPRGFQLPFHIHFSGTHANDLMDIIRTRDWYFNDPVVANFGLRLTAGNGENDSNNIDSDILVLEEEDARDLFFSSESVGPSPTLTIILQSYPAPSRNLQDVERYRAASLFVEHRADVRSSFAFLKDFIYSIIHDFPLHEALHFANNNPESGSLQTILFASPASNQHLRMGTALESYKNKVSTYAKFVNPGDITQFVDRFRDVSPDIRKRIADAFSDHTAIRNFFDQTSHLDIYFHGESTGLVPLAQEEQQFQAIQQDLESSKMKLTELVNDPEFVRLFREKQERKVDITVDEFNQSLVYVPVYKSSPLISGKRYRVNVSIGQLSPFSLMTGEVPSIDPLLPDPGWARGHLLDVVLYPKDFTLQSPACQQVFLPLLGGTDPVQFEVMAPGKIGRAELRVKIFHKNHLLQAFLLKAEVSITSRYANEEELVSVSLDLSTTSQFSNIDPEEERILYVGLNKDEHNTHSLFVKKDLFVKEIDQLTPSMIEGAQKEYTNLLTDAYFDATGAVRFSSAAKPGSPLSEEFFNQLRKFARFGRSCYNNLFSKGGNDLQVKLSDIRLAKDKAIQVGKHDLDFSFPWAMLYDYPLPTEVQDGKTYPVCLGQRFTEEESKDFERKPGFGCPHNPDIYTYCVEGFWGTRHRLEHIIENATPVDFVNYVSDPAAPKIFYSYNLHDVPTDALTTKMGAFVPKVFTLGANTNLMDLLWDTQSRPTALVVFGHLETAVLPGEPTQARIITFPKQEWPTPGPIPANKWIQANELFNYITVRQKWSDQPRPIVFLINCSSAALTLKDLNGIIKGFQTAGASAIVGTECDITSGLGARFIEEVLDAVYNQHMELGQAIRLFNQNLVASGNPLSFVFTCYGNINLTVQ